MQFAAQPLTTVLLPTDQKKSKAKEMAKRAASPSSDDIPTKVVLNPLDDLPKEGFKQGKALVDSAALSICKWCKKSIMLTNAAEHITACLKVKKDKANRKKAAREARERAKEQAQREEDRRRAEEEGIVLGPDGESGDEGEDEKGPAGKSTKKVAGKKAEGDMKGKKRKADGEPDKGPKQKKKKDEPKTKTKPKGESILAPFRLYNDEESLRSSLHLPHRRLALSIIATAALRLHKAITGALQELLLFDTHCDHELCIKKPKSSDL